jgi:predicted metal-dependent TIM-barrel fold hydrolase
MRYVEHHIHMYSRTTDDYVRMAAAGIVTLMEPSFWLGSPRTAPQTFWDYWNHMITFEPTRAKAVGIDYYTAISVNPKEAEDTGLVDETLTRIEEYLDREPVIAVGEIGFNNTTANEERAFRKQLEIGVRRNMPIMIHTPHVNKLKGTIRTVEILREMNVPPHLVDIDHCTEETMPTAKTFEGCWCGMTVYPTKLSAERAARLVQQYGPERLLVNSSADWSDSWPLGVVMAASAMAKLDLPETAIHAMVWDNPIGWMRQSPRFRVPKDLS